MTALINAALNSSRLVLAVLTLLLFAGWIAWRDIPKESEPDIRIPIIYVSMHHEGITPEDAERLLVRPMEQELRNIEGIKEMRASAYESGAFVLLEFEAGFNSSRALADVRERVDMAKPKLPQDSDEPSVHEINLSLFPVLVIALAGDIPEQTLLRLARELRDRIENIPAVLEAKIVGTRDEVVEIVIDPIRAQSYGLSTEAILQQTARGNQVIAAGSLDTGAGRFAVKVPGLLATLLDIANLPVAAHGDRVVRVRDIADVRRGFRDRTTTARMNGRPAVTLEVSKRTGENIIDTIAKVRAAVDAERATWPEAITVSYSQDRSENIRSMLADLENNLLLAAILVLVIVLWSLGWRTTALVAISVPGSFLAGILLLAGMGLTINIVVLFGLIFAAGNVVDGAIVVTEFADARMAEGMERIAAYQLAATRMAGPILSSTATQLAAFFPLLFWPGVIGEFMKYLPISQFVTMAAALLMALIFVPTLGALFGKPGGGTAQSEAVSAISSADLNQLRGFTGFYVKLLACALDWPLVTLLLAIVFLAGVTMAYLRFGHGVEFFPRIEPDRAVVLIAARGNLSVAECDQLVSKVEAHVLALQRERSEFASIYVRSGIQPPGQSGMGDSQTEDTIGTIQLEFGPWQQRRSADEILADIVARSADLAGIVIETRREEGGPPVGKPINLEVSATEPEYIAPVIAEIRRRLEKVPELRNFEDSRPLAGVQWRMEVDRAQAAKFGVDVMMVGDMLRLVTNGLKISDYRPSDSDDEVDIVVRFPRADRSLNELDRVRVQTQTNGLVPLSNFVARLPEPRIGTINRVDSRQVMTVRADVQAGLIADPYIQQVQALIDQQNFGTNIKVRMRGQDEEQRKASEFLSRAFGGAIFLIFLILLAQFNSFYHTFLILSAVVMSVFGVLIGLLIAGQPFGIVMSGIGVVALAGIVVANNIVLIDTYTQHHRDGHSVREAILITGAERLRPVLLTALNNVLGLMPMMFAINVDFLTRKIEIGAPSSQWWIQLSQAIVYGLGFATLLTLILTPCALMIRDRSYWRMQKAQHDAAL